MPSALHLLHRPADQLGQVEAVGGRAAEHQAAGRADRPVRARDLRHLLAAGYHRRDRRPAVAGVEQRQRGSAPAEHRHAERLEQLASCWHVENRLGPGADHHRRRPGDLQQVGGDVQRLGEPAMHAADAAGAHERDARQPAYRERPADGGRAERALHQAGGDVPGADLPGGRARLGEPLQSRAIEADPHLTVHDADRRGDGAGLPDPVLGLKRGRQPTAAGESVRDQGGLQRHHRAPRRKRVGYLVVHPEWRGHGIAPIVATALAAAARPRSTPPTR